MKTTNGLVFASFCQFDFVLMRGAKGIGILLTRVDIYIRHATNTNIVPNPYDLQCLKIVDNPISYLIIVNPPELGAIALQSEKIFS